MNIETLFDGRKIIPVVTIDRMEDCERIFGGLSDGGLLAAEVCFRTECAEEAIRYARKTYPKMLVGAGTVIDGGQCRRALGAGAQFIVSPGLSEDVALLSAQADVPYLPGTVTPTGIMRALALGIDRIKFFPACNFGGLAGIKSLSAAFPQVRFMPTGGVDQENLTDYLAYFNRLSCIPQDLRLRRHLDDPRLKRGNCAKIPRSLSARGFDKKINFRQEKGHDR